ncbi:hypothetical protein DFJ73DRAFT_249534 [Zopfochytrium polystomum]|nr:hypothetical protein DFJ73DRAFT_249534 [Zopfochytrium polystomum]
MNWFCHACEEEIRPVEVDGGPSICPQCGSDFLESFEPGHPPPTAGDADMDGEGSSSFSAASQSERSRAFVEAISQLIEQLGAERAAGAPQQQQQQQQQEQHQLHQQQQRQRTEPAQAADGTAANGAGEALPLPLPLPLPFPFLSLPGARIPVPIPGGDSGPRGFSYSRTTRVFGVGDGGAMRWSVQTDEDPGSTSDGRRRTGAAEMSGDDADAATGSSSRSANAQDFHSQLGLLFHALLGREGLFGGEPMVGNPGDYVFGTQSLDRVISQLMEQYSSSNAPPPASEAAIAGLKRIMVKGSDLGDHPECAVCQDEFSNEGDGEIAVRLECSHHFHPTCIESWLKVNGTCPVCRKRVTDPPPEPADLD